MRTLLSRPALQILQCRRFRSGKQASELGLVPRALGGAACLTLQRGFGFRVAGDMIHLLLVIALVVPIINWVSRRKTA